MHESKFVFMACLLTSDKVKPPGRAVARMSEVCAASEELRKEVLPCR
jgi:hypothetical protein